MIGDAQARRISANTRKRVRAIAGLAAMSIALLSFGCGDDTSTPSTPTITRTTETFSGTVQVAGSDFHSFRVSATGPTDVTLTSAGPPSTIIVGLAVGTASESGCARLTGASVNVAAASTPQLGVLTSPGTLCVQVRDVGNQAAPITYSVSVAHP